MKYLLTTHRSVKAPPAAARAWVSRSSDSPARRPIPHAARGLRPCSRGSAGGRGGRWIPSSRSGMDPEIHLCIQPMQAIPSTSPGSSTSRHRCQGRCAPQAVAYASLDIATATRSAARTRIWPGVGACQERCMIGYPVASAAFALGGRLGASLGPTSVRVCPAGSRRVPLR